MGETKAKLTPVNMKDKLLAGAGVIKEAQIRAAMRAAHIFMR
jgi:hypothetical protein